MFLILTHISLCLAYIEDWPFLVFCGRTKGKMILYEAWFFFSLLCLHLFVFCECACVQLLPFLSICYRIGAGVTYNIQHPWIIFVLKIAGQRYYVEVSEKYGSALLGTRLRCVYFVPSWHLFFCIRWLLTIYVVHICVKNQNQRKAGRRKFRLWKEFQKNRDSCVCVYVDWTPFHSYFYFCIWTFCIVSCLYSSYLGYA